MALISVHSRLSPAFASDVTFTLSNFTSTPAAGQKLRLTPLSTPRTNGTTIVGSDFRTFTLDASGQVTATNVVYGNYKCELLGPAVFTPFVIAVPDDSDAWDASDLIVPSAAIPNTVVGYTQSAADAKFLLRTNGTSQGQTLRSPTFAGSTNAFAFIGAEALDLLTTTDGTNWHGISRDVVASGGVFATDEAGSDFAVTVGGGTNLFSLPIASATKTGKLSSTDYATLAAKQPGSANLSNWSAIATSAKQDALGYTPVNRAGDTMSAGGLTNRSDGFVGNAVGLTNITEAGVTGLTADLAGKIASNGGVGTNNTFVTPTIASFANANHNHQDSAGGGTIAEAALNLSDNTTANGTTNRHGLLPKLPNDSTKFLDGTGAYSVPPSGSGTVSSVTVTADSDFEITGSPITTSGTINIANTNSTGSGKYVRQTAGTLSGATLSGSTTNTGLTASRPMKTDENKVQVSGQIDLASANEVTGILNALDFPALTGDVTTSSGALATTIANNAVTDAKFRQGVARSVVGVTGNATANTADIQGTTDQVLRVNGAGTAVGFGAIDLSKTAAASGVLQAASFPALTGDITTSAGAVATTLKNTGTAGTYAGITFDAQGRETSAVAYPAVIFVGNVNNVTLSTTGRMFAFGAGSTAPQTFSATAERQASVPIFRGGTISNLTFKVLDHATGNAMLGSGTNTTFILYTNTVASPFVFTLVTDGTSTTTNSGTSSLTLPANTTVSWRVTNQVSVAVDVGWSVEFY